MLLPSRKSQRGLRAALHDAREIYRSYSHGDEPEPATPEAAEPEAAETEAPETAVPEAAVPETAAPEPQAKGSRLPVLAGRRRQAARWLRDHPPPTPARRDDPDVVLDIPRLHVEEIDLHLDELKARVALDAHVLDLLQLNVGVDAELRGVDLKIKGVDAQAQLKVRLENLTVILNRVMNTVDRNPELLGRLADRLGATLQQVGSGAGQAVGELGKGAGTAVGDIGEGAGTAVGDIGESAGSAVEEVGGVARTLAPEMPKPPTPPTPPTPPGPPPAQGNGRPAP